MIDRHKIPFQHWSLRVGRVDPDTGLAPDVFGDIVTAIDDLDQAIANIILTPLGSVPTEPEKGCDIAPFVDQHEAIAIPNLTRVIWDALAMWEPRIVLDKVEVSVAAFSHFSTRVFWRPIESVLDDLRVTEVSFAGGI